MADCGRERIDHNCSRKVAPLTLPHEHAPILLYWSRVFAPYYCKRSGSGLRADGARSVRSAVQRLREGGRNAATGAAPLILSWLPHASLAVASSPLCLSSLSGQPPPLLFNTMAALGTGGKQGTTEWEDILRSKGILPPEKSADELASDTLKAMVEERVESYDPHAAKDVSALDVDLEEADEEEEAILRTYRDARLAEMKAASTKRRYGPGIAYISATDWKAEVTNAEQDLPVVVLLVRLCEGKLLP